MKADKLVMNIGVLLTPHDFGRPHKGADMMKIDTYQQAFIAVKEGKILDFGSHDFADMIADTTEIIDAQGRLVTPGLIDSHTHVVHAGSREHEFAMKMRGVPYMDILKQGGGIHSTVQSTREASYEALYRQSESSLDRMIALGVTTVEGKSGYGLEWDTERKQLKVMRDLNSHHPIDLVSTFMGAHALPKAYENDKTAFLDSVIDMLPSVKEEKLAEFVDIFCEQGVFDVADSRRVLEAALKHGFKIKIHADEMVALGGVSLAVSLGATSADHLMAIDNDGLNALTHSDVIANILPATSFYLNHDYAPVRTMIERNIAIALSSDYNPGSSPSENYMFTLNLAAIHLKMSPEEILTAATINGAYSLNRADDIGMIKKGYQADFVIYDAKNWPYVLYHYATNHVNDVFKQGVQVIKDKIPQWRNVS